MPAVLQLVACDCHSDVPAGTCEGARSSVTIANGKFASTLLAGHAVLLKHFLEHLVAQGRVRIQLGEVRLGETVAHCCRLAHVAQT